MYLYDYYHLLTYDYIHTTIMVKEYINHTKSLIAFVYLLY